MCWLLPQPATKIQVGISSKKGYDCWWNPSRHRRLLELKERVILARVGQSHPTVLYSYGCLRAKRSRYTCCKFGTTLLHIVSQLDSCDSRKFVPRGVAQRPVA